MLGWEYPPMVTGGLGVACYGLVKAMSNEAQVTLILPRKEKIPEVDEVEVIGLNHFEAIKEIYSVAEPQPEPAVMPAIEDYAKDTYYVPIDVSPYPKIASGFQAKYTALTNPEAIRELYSTTSLYGGDIMTKIATYEDTVLKIAADKDFDIIHAHDWITFPAAVQLKEKTGKPLVLHIHSLETDRVGKDVRNDAYYIEREAMQKADAVITVSEYTRKQAQELYGLNSVRHFITVHNGAEEMGITPEHKAGESKVVLFFGRVTSQKGPEFMLETAAKVLGSYPDVNFVVAGVGDQLAGLQEKVREWKLDDKFMFTGFLNKPQLNNVLSQTDVFLMTFCLRTFWPNGSGSCTI